MIRGLSSLPAALLVAVCLLAATARAHELARTRDLVVIYYERDGHENQCTVVTEHQGPLRGRRVIRGREAECLRLQCSTPLARGASPDT